MLRLYRIAKSHTAVARHKLVQISDQSSSSVADTMPSEPSDLQEPLVEGSEDQPSRISIQVDRIINGGDGVYQEPQADEDVPDGRQGTFKTAEIGDRPGWLADTHCSFPHCKACSSIQPKDEGLLTSLCSVHMKCSRYPPISLQTSWFIHQNHRRYISEEHYSDRAPWLRAAVLGANDGLVSVSSIMLGVGGGSTDRMTLILSGLSALVAGQCQL